MLRRFLIPIALVGFRVSVVEAAADKKPVIVKTGTIACDLVEAQLLHWKGRLLRQEWGRPQYKGERGFKETHIAIRDVETGEVVASLAPHHAFGTIFVENDTAYVVATYDKPGEKRRNQVNMFVSKDLRKWEQRNVIDDPRFLICNTSLVKANDEYVLMFEIGRPNVNSWTARFATSKDLKYWNILPPEYIHGRDYMAAPHCLKYRGGYFYNFYVRNQYGYSVFVARSRDLKNWEESPFNPVMRANDDDRKIAEGAEFTEEEKKRLATARNRNNSDIDVFEYRGKVLISYSWGNQLGTEHLATAHYDGTMADFLTGWFPAPEREPSIKTK